MIMKNFGPDVLVLTATTAGRDDVRAALEDAGKSGTEERVRTVSSAVNNPATVLKKAPTIDTILVDEATMIHPGQIVFLVSLLPNVKKIVMIGDVNQIPYIDRLRMGDVQYHKASDVCMRLPDLTITRRCPAQIVYALQDRYPGLRTSSTVMGEVYVHRGLAEMVVDAKALYMTFTQAEKTTLIADLEAKDVHPRVLTVAEAQGLTYDTSVVVRSNANKIPVFEDPAQVTTAFTRHRKVLHYYTVFAEDDVLVTWMQKASRANAVELEDVIELSPRADPSSAKAYAQAGLVLDGPTAAPTVKDVKTVNVLWDFCSSAGREDRSSRHAAGATLRSPNAYGTIPPLSPLLCSR